ncbi:MAG: hypothetical protein HY098_07730 [Nitrospinae bacterium]|nr:hypothetical protein [Nitrospinota bacterium]
MRHFLILNGVKGRILFNSLVRATRQKKRGMAILTALAALFIVGDYLFFRRILIYILGLPLEIAELLIPQFLMVICLMFFSMLAFSNIISSISALYISNDLDFLVSSPIRMREIFMARHLTATVNSSWTFFLFGVPIFVALGTTSGAGVWYYVGMALIVVPFVLVPAGMGALITTALMRWFPARKTYQFLTVIGLVFMGGIVMFFRFLQPEKLLGKQKIPMEQIRAFVEGLKIPSYGFLPSTWVARALNDGTKGGFGAMAGWVAVAWAAALALLAFNVLVASRVYYKGWSIAYGGRSGVRGRRSSRIYPLVEKILWFVSPPLRAFSLREMRVFWRDPSQWTQLFMLGALIITYLFNIRSLPLDSPFLRDFVSVTNIGLAGVVLAAVSVRFAFAAVSAEARSFWLVKSAPVDFTKYLWLKFFLYLFPLLVLSETLVVVSNILLGADRYLMAVSAAGILFITVGLTGLGVGLGAVYPVFEHENIAEVAMSTGAIYFMLISLAYIGVTIMFGVRPVWAYMSKKFLSQERGGLEVYACYAVIIVLTALMTVLPIRIGAANLRKMEV